jgi:hypothetical protein
MTNKEHPKNVRGNESNHHHLKTQYVKTTKKLQLIDSSKIAKL